MAFPATPLVQTTELALGADLTDPDSWVWTDVSQYVRQVTPVQTSRGRGDADSNAPTQRLSMQVDNTDGRWSHLNPSGPWFQQLDLNTPIRFTVEWDSDEVAARFTGYISELPPRWTPDLNNRWVDLTASGVLRRLERGDLIESPLRAYMTSMTPAPAAYWPVEDPTGSRVAASAVDGVAPAVPVAIGANGHSAKPVVFGVVDGPPGSMPGPEIPNDAFSGIVATPPQVSDDAWSVACWLRYDGDDDASASWVLRVSTAGQIPWFHVGASMDRVSLSALNNDGSSNGFCQTTTLEPPRQPLDGQWHLLVIVVTADGADADFTLYWDDLIESGGTVGEAPSRPIEIRLPNHDMFTTLVSARSGMHLALWDGALTATDVVGIRDAGMAHVGETTVDRMTRVCDVAGVPLAVATGPDDSETLGPQPIAPLLEILRDAEDSDGGVLHEDTAGALRYVARSQLYANAAGAAAFTLDLDDEHVTAIEPAADDTDILNDVTATRTGGLSARYVDQASVDAVGRYPGSPTINIAEDSRVLDHAARAVHHGTVREYRYPTVSFNLAANPALIPAWTATDVGDRVTIVNPLPGLPPETIDCILQGYTERITGQTWEVTANLSPASPWRTGVTGNSTLGRLDTAGSILQTAVDTDDTALMVATTDGPAWITTSSHASEFPFDIELAGERATVTAIAIGSGITDDFARTVPAGGWGTTSSGFAWTPESTATDFEVNGSAGVIHQTTTGSRTITCDVDVVAADFAATFQVGELITGDIAFTTLFARRGSGGTDMYMADIVYQTNQGIRARVRRAVGGSFTTIADGTAISGLTHTITGLYRIRMQIIGDVIRTRIWDATASEPTEWHLTVVDASVAGPGDIGVRCQTNGSNTNIPMDVLVTDWQVTQPQTFTVTRSVNGVVKSHAAGTAVALWTPLVVAL